MTQSESLIIAVAGPTCAGKTTLEQGLVNALPGKVAVLPFEDMSKPYDDPREAGVDSWEHPDCYRWPQYRQHLKDLREGRATLVQANFWESRAAGIYERLVEPLPLVVTVGFLALHDEAARGQFDLKLYLDIPEDVMIRRRARRHRRYAPDVDPMPYILNHVVPAHRRFVTPQREHADAVIDGLQYPKPVLDEALTAIRGAQARLCK